MQLLWTIMRPTPREVVISGLKIVDELIGRASSITFLTLSGLRRILQFWDTMEHTISGLSSRRLSRNLETEGARDEVKTSRSYVTLVVEFGAIIGFGAVTSQ